MCCPIASLASTSVKKGKKRVGPGEEDGDGIGIGIGEEPGVIARVSVDLREDVVLWELPV